MTEFDLEIRPGLTERNYWQDIWRYRELFYFLAWRDVLVRYKQTVIGVAWALIRPFVAMVVFTVILGKLAKLPSGGVPYPILVFCGLLPWQLFSSSFAESSNSIVANSSLISKIYFPRLIVPAASVVVGFLDFLISFIFLGILLIWYRFLPDWRVLAIPVFTLIAAVMSFGVGLLIAALTVKYRDFRFIVPFIVQFGLYITPVGFSSQIVPENWRLLYSLNPLVGVIDGFRWATLRGLTPLNWPGLLISLAVVAGMLLLGVWYFRKTERTFADVI
ncbi:MAG: ABC transporter permease [Verrucomicrobia bacterium]|nr:ABC transporter permease [Verrucomicrobiota bacterium]